MLVSYLLPENWSYCRVYERLPQFHCDTINIGLQLLHLCFEAFNERQRLMHFMRRCHRTQPRETSLSNEILSLTHDVH